MDKHSTNLRQRQNFNQSSSNTAITIKLALSGNRLGDISKHESRLGSISAFMMHLHLMMEVEEVRLWYCQIAGDGSTLRILSLTFSWYSGHRSQKFLLSKRIVQLRKKNCFVLESSVTFQRSQKVPESKSGVKSMSRPSILRYPPTDGESWKFLIQFFQTN